MHQERYADWLITEALKDGTLDTGVSHGKPLPAMDHDPLWWVRALMDRESMSERMEELTHLVDGLLDMAVKEPDLETARELLAKRNEAVHAWNADAQDGLKLTVVEETDLLTKRAEAPGR